MCPELCHARTSHRLVRRSSTVPLRRPHPGTGPWSHGTGVFLGTQGPTALGQWVPGGTESQVSPCCPAQCTHATCPHRRCSALGLLPGLALGLPAPGLHHRRAKGCLPDPGTRMAIPTAPRPCIPVSPHMGPGAAMGKPSRSDRGASSTGAAGPVGTRWHWGCSRIPARTQLGGSEVTPTRGRRRSGQTQQELSSGCDPVGRRRGARGCTEAAV